MTVRDNLQSITAIIILLLLNNAGIAQVKNEFSLQQTVDYGLKNAVQVKNALLDIKIQQQVNREITASALPQLNGSISSTHYLNIAVQSLPDFISPATYQVLVDKGVKDGNGNPITKPANGFGTIAAQFGVPWVASGGLEVSQLLFDGQVFVGLKARSAAIDMAQKTAAVTSEQINANIQKIYYQLVVGKKQMGSIQANIDRFTKLLNDTKEIYKNGFAEKLDVDKVSVQLNNLITEKEKINSQLIAGNAGLKYLINMPQKEELILTDTLSDDELKANILDTAFNYNDRKEIQLLTVVNKLNAFNVKRYQLSRIPTMEIGRAHV